LEIRDESDHLLVPARRKQRVLLALLLLRPNTATATELLVDSLWPQRPPASALANLQSYVSDLRRLLHSPALPGRDRIHKTRGGYLLRVGHDELDAAVFERLAVDGRSSYAEGRYARAADSLLRALALWRGPVLDGLPLPDSLRLVADRLAELRLGAVEDAFDARLALGAHAVLVSELQTSTAHHPLRERLWGQLMLALYRCGRQADALDAYQRLYRLLDEELGVRPGRALQDLHQRILAADPELDLPVTAGTSPPPRQLPADIVAFTGRRTQLQLLDTFASGLGNRAAALVVLAVTGTAGVGKTALAVHWAHQVADRFPDGQLFLNLRGFDPAGPPMTSAEAIRVFLDALGIAASRIPATAEAQLGLYRSTLAGRRMLILLDNARDAEQVRPLLPGTPTSLVLVTSRDRLTGLVATDAARSVAMDLLPADEARQLLARRVGEQRVADEPLAADELIEACARLPLALAIVAAHADARPHFSLRSLADQLRDSRGDLAAFTGADPATDLRSVFSWSYQALSQPAAQLFRLLGVHPGPDIGAPAVMSLAGVDAAGLRPLLAELTGAHLLVEHQPGRYASHDLLRAYARDLASVDEATDQRRAAQRRVIDHYLHTAHAAALLLSPHRDAIAPDPPGDGVTPGGLDDQEQALAWFTAEHANLVSAVEFAATAGYDTQAWQLAWSLANYLDRQGHWRDWVVTHRVALEATRRLADPRAQAHIHRGLGLAYATMGRRDDASAHYQAALERYEGLGDRVGQAHTHRNIARTLGQQGRYVEALHHSRRALALFRAVGHLAGQANSLNAVGWYCALNGDHRSALTYCGQALSLLQEIGHRPGEAYTWDSLGYVHGCLGDRDQFVTCFERAVDLFRGLGDRYCEADVLTHLGDAHHAAHDDDAARAAWKAAKEILDQLGHPDGEAVLVKLQDLDRVG
jgi:DNA-binding SARP family transcriptional activator